jgi:phage repressor protein C with HTH and peptisase S24 domain
MFTIGQQVVYPPRVIDSYDAGMPTDKNSNRDTVPAALLFRYLRDTDQKQADFAKQINQSAQTITNWKARGIPRGELVTVARAMRMTAEQYLEESQARPKGKVAAFRRVSQDSGSITVPVLEVEASMGAGRVVNASEPVVGGMTLSREWARGHLPAVSSYANLAVITASGDSMVPTFSDGDILLVDRGVGEVKIDAIYVIGRGDELFVKRIQRRLAGGELVVRSDNPLFEPESIRGPELGNVRILGRVVYAWNGRRL